MSIDEVVRLLPSLDKERLAQVLSYVQQCTVLTQKNGVDSLSRLPFEAVSRVGQFLAPSDLRSFGQVCRTLRLGSRFAWECAGSELYDGLSVDGCLFSDSSLRTVDWRERARAFGESVGFLSSDLLLIQNGTVAGSAWPYGRRYCLAPLGRSMSFTCPTGFGVSAFKADKSLAGGTFVHMRMSLRFSPDAVRAVVGLIDGRHGAGSKSSDRELACDRGLSADQWGISFGPLTGVVSSRGRYFDKFHTYRARHGLKDYLEMAQHGKVTVDVGIYIHQGLVAFYRLPESDYVDWECTGFICSLDPRTQSIVYPALMFSNIGKHDMVEAAVLNVTNKPPYFPHVNALANQESYWTKFERELISDNSPTVSSNVSDISMGGVGFSTDTSTTRSADMGSSRDNGRPTVTSYQPSTVFGANALDVGEALERLRNRPTPRIREPIPRSEARRATIGSSSRVAPGFGHAGYRRELGQTAHRLSRPADVSHMIPRLHSPPRDGTLSGDRVYRTTRRQSDSTSATTAAARNTSGAVYRCIRL